MGMKELIKEADLISKPNVESIVLVSIDDLQPHPHQDEIYQTETDPEFVASIKDSGIISPLIITSRTIFNGECSGEQPWVIIAGHRRFKGAVEAELTHVPCMIKNCKDADEAYLLLFVSNLNREKSDDEKINEYLGLYQILSQLAKLKQKKGIYADTVFQDEQFCSLAQKYHIDEGGEIHTDKILQIITGWSRRQQEYMRMIFSDKYIAEWLEKNDNLKITADVTDQVWAHIAFIRANVKSKKITKKEAFESIQTMLNDLLPTKKNKPAKAKKEKPEPEEAESVFDYQTISPYATDKLSDIYQCPHCGENFRIEG